MIRVEVTLPGSDAYLVDIVRLQHPPGDINVYRVTAEPFGSGRGIPSRLHSSTAEFNHRFSEGWEMCLARAFEAFEDRTVG